MENEVDRTRNRTVVVLLVQGEPDLLALTKRCLLLQGEVVVETALSASEAFKKMEIIKPDVIVCDLSFSSENSFDFLKRLRENGNDTPFISFAYDDEKDLVLKSLDLGANGFILKSGCAATVCEELKKHSLSYKSFKNRIRASIATKNWS
jgi:DNA-binding NarL/FixJ family response regulator